MAGQDSARGTLEPQKQTDGAAWTMERGQIGGERNPQSSTNNYDVTKHECTRVVLSAGTGVKNIGSGGTTPVFVMGVTVNAALVGTLTFTGLTDEAGTASNWVLPAGYVGAFGLGNAARFESGCTVQKSSASDDGKIVIDYRNIG